MATKKLIKFIDLFCGIGGFRLALESAAAETGMLAQCVLSSDIDAECQRAYRANFGETPLGDISKLDVEKIPDHDILLAGFPCQPFSIMGTKRGFDDTRGTLFFEIARILAAKRPKCFILENVKLLLGHNRGETLQRIEDTLRSLDYQVDYRVLNALHFGLPQKRERIFIVGFRRKCSFEWPRGGQKMKPLSEILEKKVPARYFASEHIRRKRLEKRDPTEEPTIWHENKAGHISAYPFSCALRAGASYNYLLVNGERRLTPREMLRLQGFPDTFKIVCNDSQARKQAGNSLPVPVARQVIRAVLSAAYLKHNYDVESPSVEAQLAFCEREATGYGRSKTKNRRKIQASLSVE